MPFTHSPVDGMPRLSSKDLVEWPRAKGYVVEHLISVSSFPCLRLEIERTVNARFIGSIRSRRSSCAVKHLAVAVGIHVHPLFRLVRNLLVERAHLPAEVRAHYESVGLIACGD
jgi:hypothetical protein